MDSREGGAGPASLDIVIVNWNSGSYLQECLKSLEIMDRTGWSLETVSVVDNASTDASEAVTATSLPLKIIRNSHNRGFAAACNQGARVGTAVYVLFLNPDTRVEPNAVRLALQSFEQDHAFGNDIAVVGGRLFNANGITRTCCRSPSASRFVARALGIDRLAVFPTLNYVMWDWPHDQTRLVDHVIGAFYLIRRDVFEHLHGFDEKFFVYLEDLDLSMRVNGLGKKLLFASDVQAFHAEGGSSRAIKGTRLFYSLRSRLQYSKKHFGLVGFTAVALATLFVEPLIRLAVSVVKLSGRDMAQTIYGYGRLYLWLVLGLPRKPQLS